MQHVETIRRTLKGEEMVRAEAQRLDWAERVQMNEEPEWPESGQES